MALLCVTIIGLFLTILSNRNQIKLSNKLLRLNFFADYTKRYQEIILNFPENINEKSFNYDSLPPDIRDKTLRYMRVYFDLCSEEYDLYMSKNLEERIWKNWEQGIEYAFSKTAYFEAWKIIQLDTIYYPEFNEFVGVILRKIGEKLSSIP